MVYLYVFVCQELEHLIIQMLETCKVAFKTESNNFNFYKSHTVCHCPTQVRMFGNLDVMDANRYRRSYKI
jgi:hypothetical protein